MDEIIQRVNFTGFETAVYLNNVSLTCHDKFSTI